MSKDTATLNTLWANLIIEELVRNGVDTFVISPGSRSTPLTVAAARNTRAKTAIHFDERGAAFFALGAAKASGLPTALICTSGTAVANYYPAIVEAAMSCVPLIVLTADRPPGLQDTGANQTIHQTNIYGEYARKYFAMPCPEEGHDPEAALAIIDHAVYAARRLPFGTVHVNCPFREPLGPVSCELPETLHGWRDRGEPFVHYPAAHIETDANALDRIAQDVARAERLLIIVGNCIPAMDQQWVAAQTKWPVIADIASNARGGAPNVIANFDQCLLSAGFREMARPDCILHMGGALVSKRIQEFLVDSKPVHYIHIATNGQHIDPHHCVTDRLSVASFDSVLAFIGASDPQTPWTAHVLEAAHRAETIIGATLENTSELTEPAVARAIVREVSQCPGNGLFIGNSMPVRDMEMFGGVLADGVRVVTNRGASGIDGNIATAAGAAKSTGARITAIIGDVAALHDLNSLAFLGREDLLLTLIVINNDGGGIFHFLPIAEQTDVFEPYFSTPHGVQFENAARLFGVPYAHPSSLEEFRATVRAASNSAVSHLIEIKTNRDENAKLHRTLNDIVRNEIDRYCDETKS